MERKRIGDVAVRDTADRIAFVFPTAPTGGRGICTGFCVLR
jgi:hypothetical protein